ncbi:metallopeptidase family protein [Corynebacterium gerontici]|uniref:Metallopeptidase family protein n=1 Tax=Corynebacterium gerontici TaxID=2079234 RepID=A0A3G6J372_9CORY|nr:metallopeptidase family protein [Corynebacterium gerontici]AZA10860.1 hypothetical protein CGERO_02680 [Corynebacterium gerontici]
MTRTRTDRHGRGLRGPLFPRAVPRFRSHSQLFDAAVLQAYEPLHRRFRDELSQLDIAIDTIPRMRFHADPALMPDEITADGAVPLGRVIPAGIDQRGNPTRARIVIFRMPIEQRSADAQERAELLKTVLVSLVATYLNMAPTDIDPDFID